MLLLRVAQIALSKMDKVNTLNSTPQTSHLTCPIPRLAVICDGGGFSARECYLSLAAPALLISIKINDRTLPPAGEFYCHAGGWVVICLLLR